jgi:hypothetical protein
MSTLQQNEGRAEQDLLPRLRRVRELILALVADPRQRCGRRFSIAAGLLALVAGMLAGCRALRDVERQSARLGLGPRKGKISDTALTCLLARLDDTVLLPLQVALVKDMKRRGQLQSDYLRLDWVAVDGKYQTLDHHADEMAQKFEDKERRSVHWRLRVLRAVLVSSPGRPALGQRAIPHYSRRLLLQARLPRASRLSSSLLTAAHR